MLNEVYGNSSIRIFHKMNKNRVYNIKDIRYLFGSSGLATLRGSWRKKWKKSWKNLQNIVLLWEKIKLLYEIFFYLSFQQNWCSLNRWLDWPNLKKNIHTHDYLYNFQKKNYQLIFTLFFIAVIWWGVRFGRWRHRIISWTFDLFNSWKM